MRTRKAAELNCDQTLYPRRNLDSHNVAALVDAINEKHTLPPIVIDKKTLKVADGFHRVKAVLQIDPNGEIECIEKNYRNDGDFFEDAVRLNATHGAKLDPSDRVRCCIVAKRLSIPIDTMAGILHMPPEKLGKLSNRTASNGSGKLTIALKNTFGHKRGQRLNKRQQEVNERSTGLNQLTYVNQLIDMIEADLLDKSNANLIHGLIKLRDMLDDMEL